MRGMKKDQFNRLQKRLRRKAGHAIADYGMLEDGDRVMVCLSGGKDSYALLWALKKAQAAAPFHFDVVAYHLDQGQPGHDWKPIEGYIRAAGVRYEIETQDTYTRVLEGTQPGRVYCSLCSRFRRAILYKAATRHGCNKVALGHHADDLIETMLLSIFYAGQVKSMPPKLLSDSGLHTVIRPLCYVPEAELKELSQQMEFPVVPCNLCGSQQAQRAFIKGMLHTLQQRSPHIKGNVLNALSNVKPSHLLDKRLNGFLEPQYAKDASPDRSEGPMQTFAQTTIGGLPLLS